MIKVARIRVSIAVVQIDADLPSRVGRLMLPRWLLFRLLFVNAMHHTVTCLDLPFIRVNVCKENRAIAGPDDEVLVVFRIDSTRDLLARHQLKLQNIGHLEFVKRAPLDETLAEANEPDLFGSRDVMLVNHKHHVAVFVIVRPEFGHQLKVLLLINLELFGLGARVGDESIRLVDVKLNQTNSLSVLVVARNQFDVSLCVKVDVVNAAKLGADKAFVVLVVE